MAGERSKVQEVIEKIDRILFVPQQYKHLAYEEMALPFMNESTVTAPGVVKEMIEMLDVKDNHKVLEIGTGTGYSTCVLSKLAKEVISIEIDPDVAKKAMEHLEKCGASNAKVIIGDGSKGYKEEAPYDRILVNAAAPFVPQPLLEQLKEDGLLVMPLGNYPQRLVAVNKKGEVIKEGLEVVFVPLKIQ